jgi:hypothetical protein
MHARIAVALSSAIGGPGAFSLDAAYLDKRDCGRP